eukprot:scaffold100396_cov33-Tisochrysis_lutea.AAC.7
MRAAAAAAAAAAAGRSGTDPATEGGIEFGAVVGAVVGAEDEGEGPSPWLGIARWPSFTPGDPLAFPRFRRS